MLSHFILSKIVAVFTLNIQVITHTHGYKVEIKKTIDFKFILQNSPHFCVVQESASGQTKSLAERSRLKKKE